MKFLDLLLKLYLVISFLWKGMVVIMSHIMGGFDGFGTSVFILMVFAFMFLYFIRQDKNLAILNFLILIALVVFLMLTDQLGIFTDYPVIVLIFDLVAIGLLLYRSRELPEEVTQLP